MTKCIELCNEHDDDYIESLMKDKKISQIEARDLAHILQIEKCNPTIKCYTNSLMESKDRNKFHIQTSYCHKGFCDEIKAKFGNIVFQDIVMDYFWCPNSWQSKHWSQTFFTTTLIDLKKKKILQKSNGRIILTFSIHVIENIVAYIQQFKKLYDIRFINKENLNENILWDCTQKIETKNMIKIYGKEPNQEDVYCTFKISNVKKQVSGTLTTVESVIDFLNEINDFHSIRFIVLQSNNISSSAFNFSFFRL